MPNIVPIEMINAHFEHNHVFRWTNTIILCSIGSGLGWGMKSTSSTIVVVVDRRLRFHHRRRHTNTYWHRNRIAFITLADRFSTNKRREKKKFQHTLPTAATYALIYIVSWWATTFKWVVNVWRDDCETKYRFVCCVYRRTVYPVRLLCAHMYEWLCVCV